MSEGRQGGIGEGENSSWFVRVFNISNLQSEINVLLYHNWNDLMTVLAGGVDVRSDLYHCGCHTFV